MIIGLAGLSGTGKSTSLRYLDYKSTFIISCTNKQLQIPGFRRKYKKAEVVNKKPVGNWLVSNDYTTIGKWLKIIDKLRPDIKTVVVDDANYCLSNNIMDSALEKGWDKHVVFAKNYYDLIMEASELREDLNVVFISHIINAGTDLDEHWQLYSSGKMLDRTVNIDGLFSYILYTERQVDDEGNISYFFRTKTNGNDTCRSVDGCFKDKLIEPNMQKVLDTIHNFEYGEEEEEIADDHNETNNDDNILNEAN